MLSTIPFWATDEEVVQERINEIDKELGELRTLKQNNRVTLEDIENVSDNYQYNLEWNYVIDELNDERKYLIEVRNMLHQ